jgi:hypothetical protein
MTITPPGAQIAPPTIDLDMGDLLALGKAHGMIHSQRQFYALRDQHAWTAYEAAQAIAHRPGFWIMQIAHDDCVRHCTRASRPAATASPSSTWCITTICRREVLL